MFQIKICGITTIEDALLAAEAGADAIGLNFYRKSARYVDPSKAAEIASALPQAIAKVGVFVNAPADEILALTRQFRLDAVQLHGDETPDYLAKLRVKLLRRIDIVRAYRCRDGEMNPLTEFLCDCAWNNRYPDAILFDAFQSGEYGGTGQIVDWEAILSMHDLLHTFHIVLAGGLTSDNVAAAIATARPNAVDTASGVESSPGRKDAEKVRAFVANAKAAFAALRTSRAE
jgi:phosphoribosylanthranilate isomerase